MKNYGFLPCFALILTFIILFSPFATQAQVVTQPLINATLEGTVVDDVTLAGIEGVTVRLDGVTHSVKTDSDGHFEFVTGQKLPFTLIVSYLGYQTQRVVAEKTPIRIILKKATESLDEVVVTSRRRAENLQDVPIPIAVIGGKFAEESGAYNVNRLKELVPSVQLYSSNPRNTGLSIRGLGTTFGLTNDGIDPGVGFYVDGVYFARTAATTLDFIDVERIEVLRGPQGTLFGKNTVAGTFNVVSRKPTFEPQATAELSYGNYGFVQARASVSGGLAKHLAGRFSFSGTQRDGLLYNVRTQKPVNDLNNLGFRGQLLYAPSENLEVRLIGDLTRQRPDGYAQVVAGVAPTQRAPYRQFDQIIADLNYQLPSNNPFDRVIDHDTPWRSGQDLGGISANVDVKLGNGTLTSTTAWRFWNWDPSNDRDFTGLQALAFSQAPSRHDQWSQELRWSGQISDRLSAVVGVFAFGQKLRADSAHTEEAGIDQWRFSQNSDSELWQTPGLLEGYGIKSYPSMNTFSGAFFAQMDWEIDSKFRLLPGIRVNYDNKSVNFRRETYGGLQTTDPDLLAIKNGIYSNQSFDAQIDDTDFSGQLTLKYTPTRAWNIFATYSRGFKPVGLNLGGLPNSGGQPMLELAVIKPERVNHYELGVKSQPLAGVQLNLVLYNTDVKDYQAQVQAADLSVNRGYLSNAEQVRVRGVEFDANARLGSHFSLYGSLAYTDGKYVRFTNAPVPLEETGGDTFKDISGGKLPGISDWAASFGGELTSNTSQFLGQRGKFYLALDGFYRSSFSSNPSPSAYLRVEGYALLNPRIGFRTQQGVSVQGWVRNALDTNYFEQLLPGAGNIGHYAGVLGDPRTYGVTLRFEL